VLCTNSIESSKEPSKQLNWNAYKG
jgi:hypothetical protein